MVPAPLHSAARCRAINYAGGVIAYKRRQAIIGKTVRGTVASEAKSGGDAVRRSPVRIKFARSGKARFALYPAG